jgi:hypothetical protein
MTHKYERISKVIKETFGEPNRFMSDHFLIDQYIKDHADLVGFAYAVLEEFDGPRVSDGDKDESQ